MRNARYLLAATLLATALCADRAMTAAPVLRPEVVQFAENLVNRLSVSFRRTVCTVRIFTERQPGNTFAVIRFSPELSTAAAHSQPQSPDKFPLPPPAF